MSKYIQRTISHLFFCLVIVSSIMSSKVAARDNNPFVDRLDAPAKRMTGALKLDRQPIVAVSITQKGRIVAVGLRGVIVLSDDGGNTWRQAKVPVQSDLTSVSFPTESHGWAAGHDGVILATTDAGETWIKQLDGLRSAEPATEYYRQRVLAGADSMQRYVNQMEMNNAVPGALPYLGIHFEDAVNGYAVGSFGAIMYTSDAGKSWLPMMHQVENDGFLNLNAIKPVGAALYMVGERGAFWVLDRASRRFVGRETGYRGTLYDITGKDNILLTVGLAGTVLRSTDGGKTWQKVSIATSANLTAVSSENGRALIVSQEGELFVSGDTDWQSFDRVLVNPPIRFVSAVAASKKTNKFIVGGYGGLRMASSDK